MSGPIIFIGKSGPGHLHGLLLSQYVSCQVSPVWDLLFVTMEMELTYQEDVDGGKMENKG
jgi:hypothetical protein